jgi:NADPH-dependent glutamate synthase beta subunit-like oxidoreductase
MARYGWRVDRFSTIDHLTAKQLDHDETVLAVLRESPRVSTFEMSEMKGVYHAIRRLERAGRIRLTDMPYPWHGVEIIEAPSRRDS